MVVSPPLRRLLLTLVAVAYVAGDDVAAAGDPPAIDPLAAETVLFLGDSITYAGHYVDLVDLAFREAAIARDTAAPTVIGIGLGSETVCGMTEPGHPFPRPNVHSRLTAALKRIRPDLVFACYGMNDGIYRPFDEERFACYRDGLTRLCDEVLATGATLVVLTPPPFDAAARSRRTDDLRDTFSGDEQGLYRGYDEVLARYAEFVRSLAEDTRYGGHPEIGERFAVVDLRTPMLERAEAERASDPTFTFTPDGIHPQQAGHRIMAEAVLSTLDVPVPTASADVLKQVRQRNVLLRDAYLTAVGHERPNTRAGKPLTDALPEAAALDETITATLERSRELQPAE